MTKNDEFWKEQRDGFWRLADRETDLLNERTNMFLLYNSILMAGIALGEVEPLLKGTLEISGLVSSLIWLYLGDRGIVLSNYAWRSALEADQNIVGTVPRVLTDFINERNRTRPRILAWSASIHIGRFLPAIWAFTWSLSLIFNVYFWCLDQKGGSHTWRHIA